jgi:CHASE1-domain containing sensor protein
VQPEEREIYVRRVREENLFALQPDLISGGERSTYFPITYTAPLEEANESRLNCNSYAEAAHREAMDLARDTGEQRATRKVYVLTEASSNSGADLALQPGFVVYLPIYQEGESLGTVAKRRRALQGFVVGSFISDKLLNGIFEGSFDPAIDFEVYDGANARSSLLLYDNDGIKRAGERGAIPCSPRVTGWRRWGASGPCTSQRCPDSGKEQKATCRSSCLRAAPS